MCDVCLLFHPENQMAQAKLYTAKSLLVHMIQLSACSHDSKVITTYAIVHSINDPSLISLTFYHP